jgi:hypothetical protein
MGQVNPKKHRKTITSLPVTTALMGDCFNVVKAKPVPLDPGRLHNPRVALSGNSVAHRSTFNFQLKDAPPLPVIPNQPLNIFRLQICLVGNKDALLLTALARA